LKVLGSISGDNLISLGRYPEKLDPLTSDEIKLAETYLRPKDSPTLSVPPKKFGYGNFISDQPTKDYFMLIAATPFLAEVASSNINPSDLRIYLNQYLARNPQNEVKFGHFYYNDFMGLISDKIKLNKDSSSQRDQCKYAEFRLKLGNAEIVTLKEIPLALALAYSGLKGGRGNPAKTPPWEIVKKIGKSLSNTAPPAITLSKSVDLLEKARIDRYCSVRFSDKNLSMSAPLCKQYEILATLDEIQSSMIMSASVMGGFMMFRYGTGQVSSWLKETLGPLPKNKADFW
jgi:hypothetical protein